MALSQLRNYPKVYYTVCVILVVVFFTPLSILLMQDTNDYRRLLVGKVNLCKNFRVGESVSYHIAYIPTGRG